MNTNCVGPSGVVHAIKQQVSGKVMTVCNQPSPRCWQELHYHSWELTDTDVTCQKCIKIMGLNKHKSDKLVLVLSPYTHVNKRIVEGRALQASDYIAKCLLAGENAFSMVSAYHHMMKSYPLVTDYSFWRNFCHTMILKADEIRVLMLPDWVDSEGLNDELLWCRKHGKKYKYVTP